MNGFETTKEYVKRHNHACIIALYLWQRGNTEEALSAGINDIIIKPWNSYYLRL
jgi:PleD family two-component response regulator